MDEFNNLNERITFRSKISVSDNMGGRVLRWSDGMTVWAWVEALRHSNFSMEKVESLVSSPARCMYKVRIRTGLDWPDAQQLKWRNKIMRILTRPVTLPGKQWIEFQVVEAS